MVGLYNGYRLCSLGAGTETLYIMEICINSQKVQIVACLSFFHFPFPGNRQCVSKPSGEIQYFMTLAYLQQCKPMSSPDTTQSTVARGWVRSYKASWRVFIHVYYSTMQKQIIQCMRLSQPCWLKLKCFVMWYLVGQSLFTDDSQEIITSTLTVVFLDCPEDSVSRIVWNVTNY